MSTASSNVITLFVVAPHDSDFHALERLLSPARTVTSYRLHRFPASARASECLAAGEPQVTLIVGLDPHTDAADSFSFAPTPAILITTRETPVAWQDAMAVGVADCLDLEMLSPARLEHAIQRVLSQAAATPRATSHDEPRSDSPSIFDPPSSSDGLLHSILRNLPVIVGRLGPDGRVLDVQAATSLPPPLRPERMLGCVFQDLFPQSRDAIDRALAGDSISFTVSGRSRAGDWHAEFFISFDQDRHAGATLFGRDITERRRMERSLLDASDAEQQRLGTDLHDGLGQQLTGLAFMAAALRDRLKLTLPAEVPNADHLAKLAREATVQSRALARGLHPVQLERHGLISAFEELAGQVRVLHGCTCVFRHRGPAPSSERFLGLHLYRIAQEAIRNAVRHGDAHRIVIALVSHDRAHRLSITDDGSGFDPALVQSAPERGLQLMGHRAGMIGGTFSVTSKPGRGARVTCTFPSSVSHEIARPNVSAPNSAQAHHAA